MKKSLTKIKLLFSGDSDSEKFENKVFSIVTFIGAIVCIFGIFLNIYNSGYFLMTPILGFLGIIFTLFFYLSFFRGITNPLILPFQILAAFGLIINWYFFQGIDGSTALYFLPTMFLLIYSNPKKKYDFIFFSYVSLAFILLIIQYLYPAWTLRYANNNSRQIDLALSFIITIFVLGYGAKALKINFDRERSITEQKNKELKISEARFRDIALSSGDWIWEMDANNIYTFCSEKAEEIIGYTPAEIIGKTPFDFSIEHGDDRIRDEYWQTINARKAFNKIEHWNLTKDGDTICVLTSGVPIINNRGEFAGFRGTNTNITLRKKAVETLKENEIRLQELNDTKDKFFSIISHDLRNPFNAIIGFSNILAEQVKEKDYVGIEEYTAIIQNSSYRAMDLLMNLSQWSRSQTGRMEFSPESIDIEQLFNEVIELLNDSARNKSITISKKLEQNTTFLADKAMIGTVLRNLISNAIKFTNPNGSIVVSSEQKQDELMVTVSDDGVGIEENAIESLFRIENNQSTTGTQNEEGTGFGLILCKEFLDKHRGKIWVESEPNHGSKFHFTIPTVSKRKI